MYRLNTVVLCLLAAMVWITGCGPREYPSPGTPFRAPTLIPTPTVPTPTVSPILLTPTPSDCTNQLKFVKDETIDDNTVVKPGSMLDKRWLVRNTGTCSWNEYYRLKLVEGKPMNASAEQALLPVRSEMEGTIRIVFTAPTEEGAINNAWQAVDPEGNPFGDQFWFVIVVKK